MDKLPTGKWGVRCTEHSTYSVYRPHKSDTLPGTVCKHLPMTRTMFVGEDGSLVFSRLDALTTTKGVAMQVLELAKEAEFASPRLVKIKEGWGSEAEKKEHQDALKEIAA